MTACEILALARSRGVEVTATLRGTLRWRCPGPLPDDLRGLLVEHKPALLPLLGPSGQNTPRTPFSEGERILADLRAELTRLRAACPGGNFPPRTANVVRLWLEVCEGYIANHEAEALRGWSALDLLRSTVPRVLAAARGDGKALPVTYTPSERDLLCRWLESFHGWPAGSAALWGPPDAAGGAEPSGSSPVPPGG
jgi:hypothetical protein